MPTTPPILAGIIHNPRLHWVEVYILQQTDKVGSRIYWLAPKPVMKQRTKAIVALVVVAHIRHADAFHRARQLFSTAASECGWSSSNKRKYGNTVEVEHHSGPSGR